MKAKIQKLARQRNAIILAHNYQPPEIQDIADLCGDSLELSIKASQTDAQVIVFCGVHFMAETASILSPQKTVLLPHENAGCPMADMVTPIMLEKKIRELGHIPVVTYVNSSADVKALSTICCTSANAVEVVESLNADEVLMIPDKNLAKNTAAKVRTKIHLWEGFCPIHNRLTPEEVNKVRKQHPEAPALTLSVLLSIDTLKSSVGLDAVTRNRSDSDRALVGQGVGNLASFLVGGMPGSGAMGPSMVNVTSGGRTYRAGMFEGAASILALLFLTRFIAWIPLAALAGILLVVAWRMFDKSMFHLLRHRSGRLDFGVIAAVVLVAATVDLMTAAGVGVALAILLFLRDQIHNSVIRRKLTLAQISSKTARLPEEREVLKRSGGMAVFCELQGNLFFGTTDQLYTHMEEDLKSKCCILFDLRRVQSLDFTAAHLFEQMHAQLAEHGGQLLFCGMPSGLVDQRNFQHYLVEVGVMSPGAGIMISDTMDGALEWMENRILESQGVRPTGEETPLELRDFELFKGMDGALVEDIAGRMMARSYEAGEKVFSHGDRGDEIFFVRRGSVRILLPLEGGQHHHLATIEQGDFFGEMGFLDRGPRSAMAEAKEPTDLYLLYREAIEQEPQMDATFAFRFMARLAIVISHRLRETDAELRTLQER